MPVITCIEDLKRLHQKRTPRMFWDYCESGSYSEQTFRENTSDFGKLRFRQRVARDLHGGHLARPHAGGNLRGGQAPEAAAHPGRPSTFLLRMLLMISFEPP